MWTFLDGGTYTATPLQETPLWDETLTFINWSTEIKTLTNS